MPTQIFRKISSLLKPSFATISYLLTLFLLIPLNSPPVNLVSRTPNSQLTGNCQLQAFQISLATANPTPQAPHAVDLTSDHQWENTSIMSLARELRIHNSIANPTNQKLHRKSHLSSTSRFICCQQPQTPRIGGKPPALNIEASSIQHFTGQPIFGKFIGPSLNKSGTPSIAPVTTLHTT